MIERKSIMHGHHHGLTTKSLAVDQLEKLDKVEGREEGADNSEAQLPPQD